MSLVFDTIAAIATAPGQGAVAIVRLSGLESLAILHRVFRSAHRQEKFSFKPRLLHHGWLHQPAEFTESTLYVPHEPHNRQNQHPYGMIIDEVLAVFMPGPASFSGEDAAEIHCHGGSAVTMAVLEALLMAGARMAEPGEFTRRAFLHGKLDLSQAEAIAEIISAPTLEGVHLARQKLQGALEERVRTLRTVIDKLRAHICLILDFSDEEDSESASMKEEEQFKNGIAMIKENLMTLISAHDRAKFLREGAMVVLAGQVNAGKSSLLNALLGRERAIVSHMAGTTRDFIEESIQINGLPLRLVDTAGLRNTDEITEAEGIRRTRELCANADIVVLVVDYPALAENNFIFSEEDKLLIDLYGNKNLLLALNKSDISISVKENTFKNIVIKNQAMFISAKNGNGLPELSDMIRKIILPEEYNTTKNHSVLHDSPNPAPNMRQARQLSLALEEVLLFEKGIMQNMPAELLSVHLDSAAEHLTRITGVSTSQDILNQIFSEFCIGK